MMKIQIIPASQQAHQDLHSSDHPQKDQKEATIYAGMLGYLSWAYVTQDVYFPTHRNGAMDCYIYVLTQGSISGNRIGTNSRIHEGDMVVMQSGATNTPVVKEVAPDFKCFEFWFAEEGFLKGTEKADFIKISAIQFPVTVVNDVFVRSLVGDEAPVSHINGLKIYELILPPDTKYQYEIFQNRKLGIYIVNGEGKIEKHVYIQGDFAEILQQDDPVDVLTIQGGPEVTTRLILMDIKV